MYILSALIVLASYLVQSQPDDYFEMCGKGEVKKIQEYIEQDPSE